MAHDAAGVAVSLQLLGVQAAEDGYRQLAALAEGLPGRPEDERRRELMRALHALRQRLLRLLVLVRWSPRAESTLQFYKVREALANRDATFHDVATRLVAVHHTAAMEPVYDARTALRVLACERLCNAECLLPASVEELRPVQPLAPNPARLDAAVRSRLLRSPRPARMRVLRVAGGLATLGVPQEYEADLTPGPWRDEDAATAAAASADPGPSAAPVAAPRRGGWRVVRVRLLVRAADGPAASALGEPNHRVLCAELSERMSASADPLGVVHFVLHELCVFTARNIAVKQAKALVAGRWAGAVRLSPLAGSPAPPGFELHYWQRTLRDSAGVSGDSSAPAAAPVPVVPSFVARAVRVQLDAEHRVVCVHEPPLEGGGDAGADGPQLSLDAISVDALMRAAVAAASLQQLTSVQAALASNPALATLPPTLLRCGHASEDAPSLLLPFPSAGATPPSLRCDWRTGALRLVGAVPLLSPAAVRELEEYATRTLSVMAAPSIVMELWRRSVRSEVAHTGRALGMRPVASPRCALRYAPGAAIPDVLLLLPPTSAALYLAVYLDSMRPVAQCAKLLLLTARRVDALPPPAEHLPSLPPALTEQTACGGWEPLLRVFLDWGATHAPHVAAEAQLATLGARHFTLAGPGGAGPQVCFDANWVAPGADTGVRLRFGGAHEAAWEALLPELRISEAPARCTGMFQSSQAGARLRYAHMEEHLGGGVPALFHDIRAVRARARACWPAQLGLYDSCVRCVRSCATQIVAAANEEGQGTNDGPA
jgi:mediator of RNA polymerase II transcription subunit 14